MKMKYVVYGRDGDELEELDWSYDEKEAERWVKEFGEERDKWIAEGKDPGAYWPEYVMQEEEDDDGEGDEDGDGGGGARKFATEYERKMWEIGMRESDFC